MGFDAAARLRTPLAAILAALLLGGCGGNAGPGVAATGATSAGAASLAAGTTATATDTRTSRGAASSSAAAPAGAVAEDLTFSGALSGHMTSGRRGDMYVCTGGNFAPQNPNTTGQLVVGPIVGQVSGKEVRFGITKINYHGPGSYDAGGVSFDVGADHYFPAKAPSGALTVNPDGRSGTLTMDLAVNSDPATVVGHAEGTWRCPPDAA